ncbi:hypothetical protein [Arthrobacter sp. B1I2]|uniref:hypothetical protein n=1 Tax=Arthrobacter sp. B1I2 TaxID=3042263 RepID=UPI002781A1D5|nr:hypothetical protein [Arthrobacter sp. B1I2]MDQ0729239.1 hypothetical protein [Arthrobacter sp. B1I2]
MPAISTQEPVLNVTAGAGEPLNLRIETGVPAAVRIEVQGVCTCQGASRRPGSYTDTDFGAR